MFGVSTFAGAPFAAQAGNSYSETVSETGGASVLVTARMDFVGGIAEASTGSDTTLNLVVYLVDVAEAGTSNDVVTLTLSRAGIVQETVDAIAVPDGSIAYPLMFLAGANALDTVVGLLSIDTAISESGTVADVTTGEREFIEAIEEAGTGADVTDRQVDAVGLIAESGAASDAVASLGILVGSITEGVDGLVVTLGNADYLLTVTEGTTGSDVVLRRLQWELIDTSETTNWQTIPTIN